MEKNELLMNIYKIHTIYLDISKKLEIEEDVIEFYKSKFLYKKSFI